MFGALAALEPPQKGDKGGNEVQKCLISKKLTLLNTKKKKKKKKDFRLLKHCWKNRLATVFLW